MVRSHEPYTQAADNKPPKRSEMQMPLCHSTKVLQPGCADNPINWKKAGIWHQRLVFCLRVIHLFNSFWKPPLMMAELAGNSLNPPLLGY